MKTIWKFSIGDKKYSDLQMPKGAEVLTVQPQFNEPELWAIVDTEAKTEIRRFEVLGTGHEMKELEGPYERHYIGTFQLEDGNFVFHLFEILGFNH